MKRALSPRREIVENIGWTVLWNGIVPIVLYSLLKPVMAPLAALLIATVAPLAENAYYVAKRRKWDVFGILMAGTFLLGAAIAVVGENEKMVLARESIVTAAVGCWFLVSLMLRRPLVFDMAERFVPPAGTATYEERWSHPYIRFVFRLMTAVWGAVLLAEAFIRVVLAFRLTTERFLIMHNALFYAMLGITIMWTALYRKYAMRKFERMIRREAKSFF
ncbi:MAG: hypothetical protein K0R28_5896 [Paenibacillus sp.]|jgi:hypothetical protein|nr:hypothetical protein [Paenibacillus sp.]